MELEIVDVLDSIEHEDGRVTLVCLMSDASVQGIVKEPLNPSLNYESDFQDIPF